MFCLLFLGKDHVEGYLELSAKTKAYFATAVALWDADFYVKVDDDVHVNIGKCRCRCILKLTVSFVPFFFRHTRPLKDLKIKNQ